MSITHPSTFFFPHLPPSHSAQLLSSVCSLCFPSLTFSLILFCAGPRGVCVYVCAVCLVVAQVAIPACAEGPFPLRPGSCRKSLVPLQKTKAISFLPRRVGPCTQCLRFWWYFSCTILNPARRAEFAPRKCRLET